MSASHWLTGLALGVAGVLGFSLRPVLIKLAYAEAVVSPVTLIFLRMMLSLPFFLAVAFWLRGRGAPLTRRDWLAVCGLGFVGYYLASFLDFLGLQYIGAGVGRLLLFIYPTLVVLLSLAFLRKAPAGRELAALVVTYAGIALVLSGQLAFETQDRLFVFGALLVFGSSLCYAIYLVAGSQLVQRIGSMRFTAYTMCVSTVPVVVQFFLTEPLDALVLPAKVWWYAILIALLSTVLPVFFAAEALKRLGASRFALVGAIGPVGTALMAAAGLEEPITPVQAAGGLLAIAGVLMVSVKPKTA